MPAVVRVQQTGEMWKQPGARAMPFRATADFVVDRVAFSWRARFPIVGPLAMKVVDEFDDDGQLRVSLLGLPLQTQKGPETAVGEAMRYLSELACVPQAIAANRELAWLEVDERTVEVACEVAAARVAVCWGFNDAGDLVGVTGVRPFPVGKAFVPRHWGGNFGEYASFAGTRVPTFWPCVVGAARRPLRLLAQQSDGARADRLGVLVVAAEFRKTPLRRLGNILITPLARLGLAGKWTHILTVPGRKTGRRYSTPVQLVIEKSYFDAAADAPLEAFAAEALRHPVFRLFDEAHR